MSKKVDRSDNGCIMQTMNKYIALKNRNLKNSPMYPKYRDKSVEELIKIYKTPETPQKDKEYLLESIYLKVFFYFPYFLGKKNYRLNPVLYDETIQNISKLILDSLQRFDPDRGKAFLSYAYGDILAAITKTFKDLNTVHVPQYARAKAAKNPEVEIEPIDCEDATADTPFDRKNCPRDIAPDRVVTSKTSTFVDGDRSEVIEYDDDLNTKQLVEWLEEALSAGSGVLSEDERMIIILHNGLFGNRPHIYSEIAEIRSQEGKGSSRSRISQIHSKAIRKLKNWFKQMNITSNG